MDIRELTFDAALIVTLASIPIVTEAQVDQPSNITRTEGQTSVIIPCPPSFVAGNVIPFWKINETFYHHSRLPCPFIASASGALIITVVDSTLNGTSFQCFAPPGIRDVPVIARRSDVGLLTVTPDPSRMSFLIIHNTFSTAVRYWSLVFSYYGEYFGHPS